MLRRTLLAPLKARPKTVSTEIGSNRYLPAKFHEKCQEVFQVPAYPGKRAIHNWRFFIKPGKAATGPPVGQEFSKLGLKPMDFCKAFNDLTKPLFKDDLDLICRVQVFHDLTYSWRLQPPPTAWFIMRAARKKRKETGMAKGGWAGYVTLEMCYEIAKYKQTNWSTPEYPPIEVRARSVAAQARMMGLAILGVDAPSSPVKDVSASQYEKQSAEYRKQQWAQWEAFKANELTTRAPLSERVHQPSLLSFSEDVLRRGVQDTTLLTAIYNTTTPKSKYQQSQKTRSEAFAVIRDLKGMEKMTLDDAVSFHFNWRLPAAERRARLSPDYVDETPFWNRDSMRSGLAAARKM